MNENKSSVLDVISGRESIKFDVSLSWGTIIELFASVMLCAVLIILLKKSIL